VLIELFSIGVTAEVLPVNIHWKSSFLKGASQFQPNFHIVRDIPANHFCADW